MLLEKINALEEKVCMFRDISKGVYVWDPRGVYLLRSPWKVCMFEPA